MPVVATVLAEVMRLGGVTAGSVADEVFVWFAPAPYARLIWIAVAAALAAWLALATLRALTHRRPAALSLITAGFFGLSCLTAVLALVTWHLKLAPATLVACCALWALVGAVYVRERATNHLSRWMPFSLYLGWLTVTIVFAVAQVATRVAPRVPDALLAGLTLLALAVLVLAGFLMRRLCDDYVFGLAIVWGLVSVGVHLMDSNALFGSVVIVLAVVGAVVMYLPWERVRGMRGRPLKRGGHGSARDVDGRPR